MASKLYMKEFERVPAVPGGPAQIWGEPASAFQSIAIDATHREMVFGAKTTFVCITSDVNVAHLITTAGTFAVTGTDFPLWANNYLCFAVQPKDTISGVLWS